MTPTKEQKWFVATVRPRHEATAARGLEMRGIEPFFPTYQVHRDKVGARRILRQPLFAGYVFCRFAREQRSAVLKTPGITSIVGFGGVAVPVPDPEIERVRILAESGLAVRPWPFVDCGDAVRIEDGPLRGVEGIVVGFKDDCRLVVRVTMLRRAVAVSIDRGAIARLHRGDFLRA
jgi:transcription antitermination factor NusG